MFLVRTIQFLVRTIRDWYNHKCMKHLHIYLRMAVSEEKEEGYKITLRRIWNAGLLELDCKTWNLLGKFWNQKQKFSLKILEITGNGEYRTFID